MFLINYRLNILWRWEKMKPCKQKFFVLNWWHCSSLYSSLFCIIFSAFSWKRERVSDCRVGIRVTLIYKDKRLQWLQLDIINSKIFQINSEDNFFFLFCLCCLSFFWMPSFITEIKWDLNIHFISVSVHWKFFNSWYNLTIEKKTLFIKH